MRLTNIAKVLLGMGLSVTLVPDAHSTTSWTISRDNRTDNFEVQRPRPVNATSQWIRFWLYGDHFFYRGRHLAIGLRGAIGRDAQGNPISVRGRGVTIGNTSEIPDEGDPYGHPAYWGTYPERRHGGCLNDSTPHWQFLERPGQVQVESFWDTGNRVYSYSCSPHLPLVWDSTLGVVPDVAQGLQNNQWYLFNIQVESNGYVQYTIHDTAMNLVGQATANDGWNPSNTTDEDNQWIAVSGDLIDLPMTEEGAQRLCGLPSSGSFHYCYNLYTYEDPWTVYLTNIEGGWNTSGGSRD